MYITVTSHLRAVPFAYGQTSDGALQPGCSFNKLQITQLYFKQIELFDHGR